MNSQNKQDKQKDNSQKQINQEESILTKKQDSKNIKLTIEEQSQQQQNNNDNLQQLQVTKRTSSKKSQNPNSNNKIEASQSEKLTSTTQPIQNELKNNTKQNQKEITTQQNFKQILQKPIIISKWKFFGIFAILLIIIFSLTAFSTIIFIKKQQTRQQPFNIKHQFDILNYDDDNSFNLTTSIITSKDDDQLIIINEEQSKLKFCEFVIKNNSKTLEIADVECNQNDDSRILTQNSKNNIFFQLCIAKINSCWTCPPQTSVWDKFRCTFNSNFFGSCNSILPAYTKKICSPGQFLDTKNCMCNPCPKGQVSNGNELNNCATCPKGYYQDLQGQTGCKTCPDGQYSKQISSEKCTPCTAGYVTTADKTDQTTCLKGKIPNSLKTACQDCPADQTANPGDSTCRKKLYNDYDFSSVMAYAFPTLSQTKAQQYVNYLKNAMTRYQINTPIRSIAFLAQVGHESEDLLYFAEITTGYPANKYDNRIDLGNIYPGDGLKYKGRGPIQLTGRDMYKKLTSVLGVDFINNPTYLEQPQYAFLASAWFWTNEKSLNGIADQLQSAGSINNEQVIFDKITRAINGGTNGKADRDQRYWKLKQKYF